MRGVGRRAGVMSETGGLGTALGTRTKRERKQSMDLFKIYNLIVIKTAKDEGVFSSIEGDEIVLSVFSTTEGAARYITQHLCPDPRLRDSEFGKTPDGLEDCLYLISPRPLAEVLEMACRQLVDRVVLDRGDANEETLFLQDPVEETTVAAKASPIGKPASARRPKRLFPAKNYYLVCCGDPDDPDQIALTLTGHPGTVKTMPVFTSTRKARGFIEQTLENPLAYLEQLESGVGAAAILSHGYFIVELTGARLLNFALGTGMDSLMLDPGPDDAPTLDLRDLRENAG